MHGESVFEGGQECVSKIDREGSRGFNIPISEMSGEHGLFSRYNFRLFFSLSIPQDIFILETIVFSLSGVLASNLILRTPCMPYSKYTQDAQMPMVYRTRSNSPDNP